jgi:Skp family chaperone for outer membrane proteins
MKRISFVAVLLSVCLALSASAQTPTAPRAGAPAQTPPARPAAPAQTPPATPKPAAPATPPPAPVPFPADAKIAFVNMQLVVAESKLGKAGQDRMKKLHDDNQAHLAALAKAIQDQQQKINTQTGVVTDTAIQALKRDLERMQLDAQAEQQKANSAEQNLNEDLLTDFSQKTMPVIDALRVEKGLWVILGVQETDQNGAGQLIVASANPGLDLSQEIIKRLDAKFPAPEAQYTHRFEA